MTQQEQSQQATSRLVLASISPRRRDLLRYLTPAFDAIATEGETIERALVPEVVSHLPPFDLPVQHHPTFIAWRKAIAAAESGVEGLILAADTIVVIGGDVLGKPRDEAHALAMLQRLAGQTHTVYTGVVTLRHVTNDEPVLQMALESADVQMAPVEKTELAAYVATGEPMDKAGAYGIQGLGGRLVQRVIGSYTCVVGLPLVTTHRLLTMMGVVNLVDPVVAFERWLTDQGRAAPPCTAP